MSFGPPAGMYFSHLRTDILARVPLGARNVLSVGCGSGRTEAELIGRGSRVFAIERDPKAAAAARASGLTVIEGDASSEDTLPRGIVFDCLVYADVLEHLPDPVRVLRRHLDCLAKGGRIVISVPNFSHYSVFLALFVRRAVFYSDAGIFDRTHVRITTRKGVEAWFKELGVLHDSCYHSLQTRRERVLSQLSCGLAKDYLAKQVVVVGEKP